MSIRSITLCALCLISATWTSAAQGQIRIPPNPFRPNQPNASDVNPAHERRKSDAEQAYRRGEYAKCIELVSSVIRENPRDDVAYYLRGSARVESGIAKRDTQLIRDGITDARSAISYGGGTDEKVLYYLPYLYGMTNLSILENRKDHAEVAVKIATQVIDLPNVKPDDKANLLYQRGLAHTYLGEHSEAAADHEQAGKLNVSHLGAYVGAADAYAAAGETEKASAAFDRAVKSFPTNPLVYNNRGMFHQNAGETDAAIADFTQAIQIDANYYMAYTNRGFALLDQGDAAAAVNDFTKSLEISPNQPLVHSLRGTAHLVQGNLSAAQEDYARVAQLDPRNPVAHADLGFAKFFADDFSGAVAAFEKAMSMDDSQRYLAPWLYMAMVQSGQEDAARDRFSETLQKPADKRDWVDYLLLYVSGTIKRETLDAAITKEDEQLKTAQTCESHFFAGQLAATAGEPDTAAAQYREAIATGAKQLSAYRGAQLSLSEIEQKTADSADSSDSSE